MASCRGVAFRHRFRASVVFVGESGGGCSAATPDPKEILETLLARVEEVIRETAVGANGIPVFVVETVLTDNLRAVLPGARFTAHDIRAWSARISR
ncbi:hypothetical protein GCM10007170_46550 [Arthrobacter liuii]|uniref:Uncharacterized protein n=1 Tax=Arthrobacter liuii TaxID=1476996 RepID=A0ABQ2AZG6_9MICC|nr:hypothetical protein GCM10007170_46550 [Arthrobacter liuii]